jgi:hypothetical protein
MSIHIRSAASGIGGKSRAGRAAQVSGKWRAAGERKKGWELDIISILTADGRRYTQIEGYRSRFHSKGRKDRKDNVTLTLRPLRSLRCSISSILYFNSHARCRQQSPTPEAATRTQHFPTHAQRMSTRTRSVAPGMGGRRGLKAVVHGFTEKSAKFAKTL